MLTDQAGSSCLRRLWLSYATNGKVAHDIDGLESPSGTNTPQWRFEDDPTLLWERQSEHVKQC